MSRVRSNATPRGRSGGQSLVEFSLVVPIFFLMLFGLIDGGRLVFANNTLSQDAHEALRTAAVQAPFIGTSNCTAPVCPADTGTFHDNVVDAANGMNLVIGTISSSELKILCSSGPPAENWSTGNDCSGDNGAGTGNTVAVRITINDFRPLMPLWGWFYPSSLSAGATMAIP